MRLNDLISALPDVQQSLDGLQPGEVQITSISADSRQVQLGSLFVAYRGVSTDGHQFIGQALANGARAIVGEQPPEEVLRSLRNGSDSASQPIAYVQVRDGREALAYLHAAWFGHPARRLKLIGVTGTDGKTTVVNLTAAILRAAGKRTGLVCTVGADIEGLQHDTGLHTTTPDAPDVQAYLAEMVDARMEYAVLEATSHGLAQHRLSACDFDVAAVTNITHEHLDFHGSREAYVEAKALLFANLSSSHRKPGVPKVSVLNGDDSSYDHLRRLPAEVHLVYGLSETAMVRALDVDYGATGTSLSVVARLPQPGVQCLAFELHTALVGEFNVYNCLAATTVALSQGVEVEAIQRGIASMPGVIGRMERIDEGQGFLAIVDFAHTPRALEVALQTARRLVEGQVIVVFGCAGMRDVQKRAWMGRIAGMLADRVVITSEDPRTESLDDIMAEIARGCEAVGRRENSDYWRIPDRSEAIDLAVGMARTGDLVIVTGKGHERSMCFGAVELPWSDHAALRAALRNHSSPGGGVAGARRDREESKA